MPSAASFCVVFHSFIPTKKTPPCFCFLTSTDFLLNSGVTLYRLALTFAFICVADGTEDCGLNTTNNTSGFSLSEMQPTADVKLIAKKW